MEVEELLKEHKGLIYYHMNREWPSSPLTKDEVKSIGYMTLMECYDKWDRERPFGKYFGTCLTYAIRDARIQTPFTVSSGHVRRGAVVPECVSGDLELDLYDGTTTTIIETVADERPWPFMDEAPLRQAIKKLPIRQRKVMELVLLDYNQSQIGKIIGRSREAVRQQYDLAIENLRRDLWH